MLDRSANWSPEDPVCPAENFGVFLEANKKDWKTVKTDMKLNSLLRKITVATS